MAQWTGVLGCGGHHIVFCDCAETSVAAVAKEESDRIPILRGWELDLSHAISTQRWGSLWKLSIVSMKELCPT